ncbi:hypothetical protein G5T42_13865 [Microbacterium sp. 4R-513]|uniref:hypothetical protein n=1 Tax=Microbacterium sp. 4R-513 TaxID=2567934 RepID=UPI0013E1CE46|nr:hypothetical protein [Microbacterium sp. 4R-513]QIG40426.1 hypothetical protein G5T42_13865 [Microbacterium sp. 4R-513]
MAPKKTLRDTALWAILAERHPSLWEEIIGPSGPLGRVALNPQPLPPKAMQTRLLAMRAGDFDPQPEPPGDAAIGVRYGLKTAFAVVRAAGLARLFGVAFDDIPDICPPEPDPFPPLPDPPDPIPWRTALKVVPDFYADYALGLAIGLEATAGDWQDLPGADALEKLHARAIGIAPVRG